MYFLSDAYHFRAAIIAERREDREKAAAATIAEANSPVKTAPRPHRFVPPIFRLPLLAAAGKTK
jgi:hypothetical protein